MTSPRRSTSGDVTSLAVLPSSPPPPAMTRSRRDLVGGGGTEATLGRYVCTLYVLLRVAYSVAFTFTAVYLCLVYLVSDDVQVLSGASQLQWNERNSSSSRADVVRRRWRRETERQESLVDRQRHACAQYVDELTAATTNKLRDALMLSVRHRDPPAHYAADASHHHHHHRRRHGVTVTETVQTSLLDALASYAATLDGFKRRYRDRLADDMAPSLRLFADYLSSVQFNEWLGFARALFNQSVQSSAVQRLLFHGAGDERFQSAVLASSSASDTLLYEAHGGLNLSGVAADFAGFIDIQEVDDVQLWSRQFWER